MSAFLNRLGFSILSSPIEMKVIKKDGDTDEQESDEGGEDP